MAEPEKKPEENKKPDVSEDEEEDGYTCGKCCTGYGDCIVATCRVSFII